MPSTIIPSDYYATASSLFDYTATNATLKSSYGIASSSSNNGSGSYIPSAAASATPTTTIIAPPEINAQATVYIYGFCLILIPIATLLGNLLVIVSVLRFKALHSAINFLILGLAVADLLVAFLVMPYAVLVYVQGGYWFLGNLMCDIYSASDVACSTASILLLAVISFDRYRAVSRPIQYSRQSQNIQRVVFILIAIWLISILLASPIVFGVNYRPPDANPYECRFYNPEFSIMSSFVSFVIPCFIVLFVYIRIMMALRKREKAAKARRNANSHSDGEKKGDLLDDEAGQIVAGPAVNVMMLALPSMTRRIRRYERHKAAVENAGEEEEIEEDEEVLEEEGGGGGVPGFSGDEEEDDDEYEEDDSEYDNDELLDSEEEDLHGSGITDDSAVDSGIDGEKKRKNVLKGRRHRKRRITSSGADSLVAAAIATKNGKNKTNATPQALCLSSFLPILGTATANVGRPRRRSATAIRKPELPPKFKPFEPLSLPSTSRTPFDNNDNDCENNVKTSLTIDQSVPLFLIEKNLSDQQLTTKHLREQIWQNRANFFRSKSGPPMLDSKSPLMLRRFMLDPENDPISIQTLDVQKLNSAAAASTKEPILTPRSGSVKIKKNDHDLAGSLTPRSSTDSLSENVNIVTNDFISEGPTSMSRRSSDFDSSFANNTMSSFNSSNLNDRSERSAISEHKRKKHLHSTFYFHRRSSTMPDFDPKIGHVRSASVTPSRSPFLPAFLRQLSKRSPRLFRGGTSPVKQNSGRKNVYSRESPFTKVSRTPMGDISKPVPEEAIVIENSGTGTPESIRKQVNNRRSGDANTEEEMDQLIPSTTDTETASAVGRSNALESATPSPPMMPQGAIISRSPMSEQKYATASVARQLFFERNASIDENQELLVDCTVAATDASGKLDLVIENENAKDETPKHHSTAAENRRIKNLQNRDDCGSPSVSFNIAGKTFFGGREAPIPTLPSTTPFERNSRRRSSCMETWSESNKQSESIGLPSSVSSNMISSDASIPGFKNRMFIKQRTKPSKSQQSIDSNPSISSSVVKSNNEAKKKLLGNSKVNGSSTALAVRIVKRTMHRKESSLKRKVTKAQRKERRATKTLGIVVGIFLICWVPFFTINILNAVCVKLDEPSCQVGFGPFFYATWIGYMNSFMNPVIYTIFNTEFRRAFKSIILGRNAARRHRARNV